MSRLRVVTFNVFVGQPPGELHNHLRQLARDTQPEVLALQEARRLHGSIPGYRRWAADDHDRPGAADCVLLVKHGVRIVHRGILAIDGPHWTGPHLGIVHPPRVFPWVALKTPDGQRWDVMCDHRVPGGKAKNRDAWRAEDQQLERWHDQRAVRLPKRPRVIAGDQNGSEDDRGPLSLTSLANRTRSQLMLAGIDGVLASQCRGSVRKLDHGYGSDGHRPVVAELWTS